MSNGQAVNQQLITRFTQDLRALLRLRPGLDLESLAHSTAEMPFDLGKARKNKLIHSRAGDRIFVTELTGIAYIRFNSTTGSKYKLRLAPISSPFQKLYLENEAQAGKTLSLIIGYGPFVDFAVSYFDVLSGIAGKDFAEQTTLALIKAKTDFLTKLDVNLSTLAKESGGNLATIAGKDFAEQTTLALIKAKTDKLDVNLSTLAKESGGNLADIAGLDFAEQATLALIKAKTDLLATIPKEASATPTPYNVTMTNANEEYEQALPNGTKQLTFFVRGGEVVFRYAWVTGKVAIPTAPYTEVPADGIVFLDKCKLDSKRLYFACASAGKIMQIEVLT